MVFSLYSQNQVEFYCSKSNDFIYLSEDTVYFRFFNNDAFNTYIFGKCICKYKKNGRIKLTKKIPIASLMTTTSSTKSKNNTTFSFYYYNNIPKKFLNVRFLNDNLDTILCTNENGIIYLDHTTINKICKSNTTIKIKTVGFTAEMNLLIKDSSDYIVKSVIPNKYPFSLVDKIKEINIKIINETFVLVRRKHFEKRKLFKKQFSNKHILIYGRDY